MYVDDGKGQCQLNEGGMVERDYGRAVFESIVRKMKDPALLEWVDGSTFKMRVFPLEGRQEKRIVLSYTQKLPSLYGRSTYRFPAGHSLEVVRDWSFHASIKGGAGLKLHSPSHPDLKAVPKGADLELTDSARLVKVDKDIVLECHDARAVANKGEVAHFSSVEHEDQQYLMLRYRPELPGKAERQRRDWVFLFESSGDRDPLLARVQIDVIRTLLANAEHDDTFAVLTAGSRVHQLSARPQPATPENVKAAVAFLEQAHLIGALDLGGALAAAEPWLKQGKNPYLVHVGAGLATMGEQRPDALAKSIPEGTRYVGVAVGKRWARGFMKVAAERTAGYFTQINPDEPVAWRAFELFATLNTPRLLDVKAVDDAERAPCLTFATALAQGEELCAVTRVGKSDPLPESVSVAGTLDGQPFRRTLKVKDVARNAGYLPRTWAKLEIERLLADNALGHKAQIIRLSNAMYVMTPFTSLLVLENEAMYQQYNVDRGRKDHWAMYDCPKTIAVVHEPLAQQLRGGKTEAPAVGQKPTPEQVLQTILVRVPPSFFARPAGDGRRVVTAEETFTGAYAVPELGDKLLEILDEAKNLSARSVRLLTVKGNDPGLVDQALQAQALSQNLEKLLRTTTEDLHQKGGFGRPFGPMPDSGSGTNTGSGNVDPKRLKELAEVWGRLPERELVKRMDELTRDLPPRYRQVIQNYFQKLGKSTEEGGGFPPMGPVGAGDAPFGGGFRPPILVPGPTGMPGGPGLSPIQPGTGGPAQSLGGFSGGFGGFGGGFSGGLGGGRGGFSGGMPGGFGAPLLTGGGGTSPGGLGGFGTGRPGSTLGTGSFGDGSIRSLDKDLDAQRLTGFWTTTQPLALDSGWASTYSLATGNRGFQVPMAGPVFASTAFEYPVNGLMKEGEQTFNFWLGYFADNGRYEYAQIKDKKEALSASQLQAGGSLLYQRPAFSGDARLFHDLTSYAPGLNTNTIDVWSVLEAEAGPDPKTVIGAVEPAARELIDKARAAGWQTLTVQTDDGKPAYTVTFDAAGRYVCERTVGLGLREQVVCDGQTLLHLYPEIGLGARRSVSRFHRAEFAAVVPWVLPPVEDLTRGADLRSAGERTVAVVPHGIDKVADSQPVRYARMHLVFRREGQLAERQLVEMPSAKVLVRQTYGSDGQVKLLDGEGRELASAKLAVGAARPVSLKPDLKDLVVLPLPYRSREHVLQKTAKALVDFGRLDMLSEDAALALLAADFASGNNDMTRLISQRYLTHGDQRPGFTVLLSAVAPLRESAGALLARVKGVKAGVVGSGFVRRLSAFHEVIQPWLDGRADEVGKAACQRLLDFVRDSTTPVLTWAVTDALLRNTTRPVAAFGGRAALHRRVLEEAARGMANVPELAYAVRYELARNLLDGGDHAKAQGLFRELYAQTRKKGVLPAIDRSFRLALEGSDRERDQWGPLIEETAAPLLKQERYATVLALAWQCQQVGDPALADRLIDQIRERIQPAPGRFPDTALAVLAYLWQQHRIEEAAQLLQPLLADKAFAQHPSLWRLAAQVAARRKQTAQSFAHFARALDLDFRQLPEVIDVAAVRRDYGALLAHYESTANALATLQQEPSADFLKQVIRTADRWRTLDTDGAAACQSAARILKTLGAGDLAWDYLTTPLAEKGGDAGQWVNLAQSLQNQGDLGLAQRAYSAAFAADPSNAQLLWDQVQCLQQTGKAAEARSLLRRLAQGQWQPQYQAIQAEAVRQLDPMAAPAPAR
jgi:tetratricopeptide (TPR) repeat protein